MRDLNEVLVVKRLLVWRRRLTALLVVVPGVAALALVMEGPANSGLQNQLLLVVILLAALTYAVVLILRLNRVGVFTQGIAPPLKPHSALFDEPYIIPWTAIEVIELSPESKSGRPPNDYWVSIRLRSGKEARFTSTTVANQFRSESQGRRFYALLAIASASLREGIAISMHPTDRVVKDALQANWPEGSRFRRTAASWIGTLLGGVLFLISLLVTSLGPTSFRESFITVGSLALLLFLASLLTPRLLAHPSKAYSGAKP